jgi:hypothetical protein
MPGSIREGGGVVGVRGMSGRDSKGGVGVGVISADQAAESHKAIIIGTRKYITVIPP